jgi:CheY-like chemotaxis protein
MKNAVKFTPEGGTITIRTSNGRERHEGTKAQRHEVGQEGERQQVDATDPSLPSPLRASVSSCLRASDPNSLIIEVIDTGVGIAPEALPHIFDAFEQGSREVTRQFGGLGLGLAISKALTDLHHGTLAARSDGPGRGATFTLTLPVLSQSPAIDGTPIDHPGINKTHSLHILLVEDHESTARVLARLLSVGRHRVEVAHNVAEALKLAGTKRFDLLISDLGLPDGSGLDLIRRIREIQEIKGIALSGYGMEEDLARSKEAGFALHLTKPVDFRQLQSAIAQVAV